jgi:hypothetical protein
MFRIVSAGWNCNPVKCIDSVIKQDRTDWVHYLRMDGEYWMEHNRVPGESASMKLPLARKGALFNYATMMNNPAFQPEDVIVMLDADDWLYDSTALSTVAHAYNKPGTLLTYGSYEALSGTPSRFNGAYKPSERVRQAKWRGSHLKTFKVKLWMHLPSRYLMGRDGKFLPTCYDLAVMMPLMEMAGLARCVHIPQVLYVYNDQNPANDHKVNREQQKRDERYVRRLPEMKRVKI